MSVGSVYIDREELGMSRGPYLLGISSERQIPIVLEGDLMLQETVLPDEPIHLVQAVLPCQHIGIGLQRMLSGEVRFSQSPLVGAEVDAAQPQSFVQ